MPDLLIRAGLAVTGLFAAALGSVHFFFPRLLDFEQAIPKDGPPLRPFHLGPIHYPTRRADVHGIAWVMNHAASYVLVSLGLLDLYWALTGAVSPGLALWVAGWWTLRAGSQLFLGRRRGDWWILAGFLWLAVWHVAATWAAW